MTGRMFFTTRMRMHRQFFLPYEDPDFAMVIVLSLSDVEEYLDHFSADKLASMLGSMQEEGTVLYIPKFE